MVCQLILLLPAIYYQNKTEVDRQKLYKSVCGLV